MSIARRHWKSALCRRGSGNCFSALRTGVFSLAIIGMTQPVSAAVVIDMVESGGNVVATASGTLNINDLGTPSGVSYSGGFVAGTSFSGLWNGAVGVGSGGSKDSFDISTDVAFSTGNRIDATSSSGSFVGIISTSTSDRLQIDPGYTSGAAISGTSTWASATFASLGLIEGTYVVTWGSGENVDSLTLNIGDPQAVTYTIGGTVTGLAGTLTLQNNDTDDLTVNSDGAFTFATALEDGGAYRVEVSSQPAGQTCTVSNGIGTATADVSNVAVACVSDISESLSAFTANASSSTVGSAVTLTVTVRDSAGDPVSGIPVTLAVESAGVDANAVDIVTSPTVTDANGESVFSASSSVAQDVEFRASFNPDLFLTVTWTSATMSPQAIPTMSNFLLLVLALGALAVASRALLPPLPEGP